MKIIKFIKNSLVPNLQNSWHPYLMRTPALVTVAASLLLVQVVVNIQEHSGRILGANGTIESQQLVDMTNRLRSESGVRELEVNGKLQAAAQAKAEDMLVRDYWAHYAPDGTSPWMFLEQNEYGYRYAGENLAKQFSTSEGVIQGWIQSPAHRDNLLDDRFSEIGIATASGRLNGAATTVVVALYADPQPLQLHVGEVAAAPGEVLPAATAYSLVNPLMSVAILPIATQLTVFTTFGFSTLYLFQHLVIRKRHLLWDQHVHPRPLLRSLVLLGLAVLVLQAGWGAVG
ncbi:MAG: CAP domain-containing protein [Candidatus Saccharimonadales bacterium]